MPDIDLVHRQGKSYEIRADGTNVGHVQFHERGNGGAVTVIEFSTPP